MVASWIAARQLGRDCCSVARAMIALVCTVHPAGRCWFCWQVQGHVLRRRPAVTGDASAGAASVTLCPAVYMHCTGVIFGGINREHALDAWVMSFLSGRKSGCNQSMISLPSSVKIQSRNATNCPYLSGADVDRQSQPGCINFLYQP